MPNEMPLAPASRDKASADMEADVWLPVAFPDGPAAPEGPAPLELPGLGVICPAALTNGRFKYGGSYFGIVLFRLCFIQFKIRARKTKQRKNERKNSGLVDEPTGKQKRDILLDIHLIIH